MSDTPQYVTFYSRDPDTALKGDHVIAETRELHAEDMVETPAWASVLRIEDTIGQKSSITSIQQSWRNASFDFSHLLHEVRSFASPSPRTTDQLTLI